MREFFNSINGRKLLSDISKAAEALSVIATILTVVYEKQLEDAKKLEGEK